MWEEIEIYIKEFLKFRALSFRPPSPKLQQRQEEGNDGKSSLF
jgi:hypothetical protein